MLYVICYDVSDQRRRTRAGQFLEGLGRRVEKSVFECCLAHEEIEKVRATLGKLLTVSEDRCHIYRVCSACACERVVIGGDLEGAAWPGGTVIV